MQKRITWLGIFCSIMIPALGILSRRGPTIPPDKIPVVWVVLSIFLLGMWFLNYYVAVYLRRKFRLHPIVRIGIVAVCDVLLLLFYFLLIELKWLPISSDIYNIQDYQLLIRMGFAITLASVIQYAFVSVVQKGALKRQNDELRYENLRAELEGLKQQINPHFLFNSLGTLRAMIHEKDENAEQFVLRLSAVYRQFLSKRNENITTIREELSFLDSYLYMLRFRYEDSLHMLIDLEEDLDSMRVPAFSLQLLVENCIKHNVLSIGKPLSIRIYQKEPGTITVENTKQPRLSGVDSMGVGLDNLRQRYKLSGVSEPIMVEETDTMFSVSITLLDS